MKHDDAVWIFGYGSLMWDPGFPYEAVRTARVFGYHRALCVTSWHFRGTRANPGLVLGLDYGGSCKGRVFRIANADRERVFAYLHDREMITDFYKPKWLTAYLKGTTVRAYAFVADPHHAQYAGDLSEADQIHRLLRGTGKRGRSLDYLRNVIAHLDDLNIPDGPLHELLRRAEEDEANGSSSA